MPSVGFFAPPTVASPDCWGGGTAISPGRCRRPAGGISPPTRSAGSRRTLLTSPSKTPSAGRATSPVTVRNPHSWHGMDWSLPFGRRRRGLRQRAAAAPVGVAAPASGSASSTRVLIAPEEVSSAPSPAHAGLDRSYPPRLIPSAPELVAATDRADNAFKDLTGVASDMPVAVRQPNPGSQAGCSFPARSAAARSSGRRRRRAGEGCSGQPVLTYAGCLQRRVGIDA